MEFKNQLKNFHFPNGSFFVKDRIGGPEGVSPSANLPRTGWQFQPFKSYRRGVSNIPTQYLRLRKYIRRNFDELLGQASKRQKG